MLGCRILTVLENAAWNQKGPSEMCLQWCLSEVTVPGHITVTYVKIKVTAYVLCTSPTTNTRNLLSPKGDGWRYDSGSLVMHVGDGLRMKLVTFVLTKVTAIGVSPLTCHQ